MRDYDSVLLSTMNDSWRLELVPEYGGLINSLVARYPDGERCELIAGLPDCAAMRDNAYFRGVALYPFPNRLRDGCWRLGKEIYRFAINEPARHNSLHGFLHELRPEIERREQGRDESTLTLLYRYPGDRPGYPFPAEIRLHYALHADQGLRLCFELRNLHAGRVPLGFGWHPYFTLGVPVDTCSLQLPPASMVEVDARLLPTGAETPCTQFARPRVIGARPLDNCFRLADPQAQRACTRFFSPARGKGIELWQQARGFPFLQLCIPPDRGSLAMEPVSCGIDALNSGDGLVFLGSGEVHVAYCGVRLI